MASSTSPSPPTATFPSSSTSLCPGYRHVEEFGPDEEYEEEIEEFYVTLDLSGAEPTLIPSSSAYRLIGLDTPNPFMQLAGTVLRGRHESLLGTELIFTDAKDTQDKSKRHLAFTSATEKRIRFKEVLLRSKEPPAEIPEEQGQMQEAEILDRMTGKGAGSSVRKRKSKTNGSDPPRATRRKSVKAKDKGKGKAVEESEEHGPGLGDELMSPSTTEKVSRKRSAGKGKEKAVDTDEEERSI